MKVLFFGVVAAAVLFFFFFLRRVPPVKQTNFNQSKTKILLLMKLGNFSKSLSTAQFSKLFKFSKFNNFYDIPNRCDVIILGEIVFLSQIFQEINQNFIGICTKLT